MAARWLRAVGAGVLLAVLLVGVPVLLIGLAGWPLPTGIPDWERAATMVRQGDIPAATVIKAIAVIVWLAWVQLAWAVVWEAAVNVPRTVQGRRHQEPPLVAAPVAAGVGRLFAAILAVGAMTATSAPVAAPRPARRRAGHDRALSPPSSSTRRPSDNRHRPRRRRPRLRRRCT